MSLNRQRNPDGLLLQDLEAQLEGDIAAFLSLLDRLNVKLQPGSAIERQFRLVEDYLGCRRARSQMLVPEDGFTEWYGAVTAVVKLTTSVTHSPKLADGSMAQRLGLMLDADLTQGAERSEGKDLLYEHEVAYLLSRLGFRVELAEPDVLVSGGGQSATLGIACKYPSSARQVLKCMTRGYRQVGKRGLPGIVAIGLDQLVLGRIERPQIFFHDIEDAQRTMAGTVKCWVDSSVKRAVKQHSPPVGAALYTLNLVVALINPRWLTLVHVPHILVGLQSDPLISEFLRLLVQRSQLQFVGNEADNKRTGGDAT